MPFDAEALVRATDTFVAEAAREVPAPLAAAFALAGDPDPRWAAKHPDRCLAYLFVSPRDCAAVDALLAA